MLFKYICMIPLCMTYYDEIAEGYEELHKEEQDKKIEVIKRFLKPKKTDKLLDIGCGTGLTTRSWGCESYGIDPARKLVEKAMHRGGAKYFLGKAEELPFKDDFFDIVISVTAIQNFDNVKKAINEIKRVAKPKAQIIMTCLKKSKKKNQIRDLIYNNFIIKKEIDQGIDIIWIGKAQ